MALFSQQLIKHSSPSFYLVLWLFTKSLFVYNFAIASNCGTLSTPLLSTLSLRSITSKEKSGYFLPLFKVLQRFSIICETNPNSFILPLKFSTLWNKLTFPILSLLPSKHLYSTQTDKHPTASYLLSAHYSQCLKWFSSMSPTSVIP